jgi:uncharacterized protein
MNLQECGKKSMKRSRYNHIFPLAEKDTNILYNMLTGSIMQVDDELRDIIDNEKFESIGEEGIQKVLADNGIIIPGNTDESELFCSRYDDEKQNPDYYLFVVLPTFACNLSCPYCYEGSGEILTKTMDTATLKRTIDFIKNTLAEGNPGKVVFKLYGGEPLLAFDICTGFLDEIIPWCRVQGIKADVILQTNGTLIDEKVMRDLIPEITAVEVTLDGSREKHNTIRRYKDGSGSYDDIIRNLIILLDSGVKVVLRINADNPAGFTQVLDEMNEFGLKKYQNLFFYTAFVSDYSLSEFLTDNGLCSRDAEKSLELKMVFDSVVRGKGWQNHYQPYSPLGKQKAVSCNFEKKGRFVVDPSGDLYKCLFCAGMKEFRVGTIRDDGEQLDTAYYDLEKRNPRDFAECRECRYLPACGGGCPVRALINNGTYQSGYCGTIPKFMDQRILVHLQGKHHDHPAGENDEIFGL